MKYTRKLMKESTHSFALVIPKEIVKKFGWKEKQKILIEEKSNKTLEIKNWKKK